MTTITAAVCRAFGAPLAIEELTLAPPGPGEVEVEIAAVAICHSDISFLDGAWGGGLPAVFGHEAAGRVVATGAGVAALAPGQAVIVTLIRSCGECPACAAGAPVHCAAPYDRMKGPLATPAGEAVGHGLNCAAFATRAVVQARQCAPVPGTMPMAAACLLACGVITGVGAAVNTARIRPGETVVVVGAGGVGLNAIQGARLAGAARIFAVDPNPDRRADALLFGATDAIDAAAPRPWEAVRALTSGRGADAVLVATGAIAAYATAARFLARQGRLVAVGMPAAGAEARWEPMVTAYLGQRVIGSPMGDTVLARDIPWMIDLWRQGRLRLDDLVTRTWPLAAINEAIADTRAGRARRNVILPAG
ncbi:MAG: zinc-binding dehydrogenase [Rhodobacteraceae bacterium]|nr:zinc-binding dehydrogenase [Paracoccaceae bacterium]